MDMWHHDAVLRSAPSRAAFAQSPAQIFSFTGQYCYKGVLSGSLCVSIGF